MINKSDKYLYFIIGIISVFVFICIYGVRVLNPFYTDWLMLSGDTPQHYLGWLAFMLSDWHFGLTNYLAYPHFTSVIFTDSIPLFAFIFKLFAPFIKGNFQYFGLFGLICFIFQGIFSARIFKCFTQNKLIVILCSTILLFTPILIHRMFMHTSLSAQFIIIILLYAVFNYNYYLYNKKIYILSALIAFLSASIHIYFLLFNALILLGICICDIFVYKRIKRTLLIFLSYTLTSLLTIWFFSGFYGGMKPYDDGLGVYNLNLNSLFNSMGYSCIFSSLPLVNSDQHEGFSYIGAGIVVLLFSLLPFFHKIKNLFIQYKIQVLSFMFISLIAFIIALSPVITLGENTILKITLPEFITNLWSTFRSSGRTIWIVIYLILFSSLILSIKLFKPKYLIILLCFVLSIQIYDMHYVLFSKFQRFSTKSTYISPLKDNIWNKIAKDKDIKHLILYSNFEYDELYSPAYFAFNNNKTINKFYFSRPIHQIIENNLKNSIENISEHDIFIFSPNDKSICYENNLYCYYADNLIIGYIKPIE